MFAWPGTPAPAVTRPPPTAGPRLRNLMFSRMSWLFSSAAFCFSSARAAMHKIRVVSSASTLTVLDVIGLLLKKVQYFIPNTMKADFSRDMDRASEQTCARFVSPGFAPNLGDTKRFINWWVLDRRRDTRMRRIFHRQITGNPGLITNR